MSELEQALTEVFKNVGWDGFDTAIFEVCAAIILERSRDEGYRIRAP
jgi:hypothetical protein